MTFADKKIEELKDFKILYPTIPSGCYSEKDILDAHNNKIGIDIKNWLKQTIAEAEREFYLTSCENCGGKLPVEFHKFWNKKLKQLEE